MTRVLPPLGRPGPGPAAPADSRGGAAVAVPSSGDVDAATCALQSVAQLQASLRAGPRVRPEPAASPARWWAGPVVLVMAAHPGAGCSTVALAVAEAATLGPPGAGRGIPRTAGAVPVLLVDVGPGSRSGLTGVSDAELGVDPDGRWRRGRRGALLVCRRADDAGGLPWSDADGRGRLVVDLGTGDPTRWLAAPAPGPVVVVVCRASVPGVRDTERVLRDLASAAPSPVVAPSPAVAQSPVVVPPVVVVPSVLVAAVGGARWSGPVRAGCGPLLRARLDAGAVAAVPVDRRLSVAGLSTARLPRAVAAAGGELLRLIEAARAAGAADPAALAPAVAATLTDDRWSR